MPVVLKNSSTIKGNCTECFHREWEVSLLPFWQHTMLCYENHDVHISVNDSILRCCFALGFASVLFSRSTINDKKKIG